MQHSSFRPLSSLTKTISWSVKLLLLSMFAISLSETLVVGLYPHFNDAERTVEATGAELGVAMLMFVSGIASLVGTIVSGVTVLRFMHRANSNLRGAGVTGLQFSPRGCVGWWFVPVACLWAPFNAMGELYKASTRPNSEGGWSQEPLPDMFNLWWGTWLLGGILSRLHSYLLGSNGGGVILGWCAAALLLFSGLQLFKIVAAIGVAQERNLADLTRPESSLQA